MRKRLWQLHSWLGLVAGLGLLVIGISGSLLVFRDQLEAVINPELVRVVPSSEGRLSFDTLLAAANRQLPGHEVVGWLPRHDAPAIADLLYVMPRGTHDWQVATLDPYRGTLLATPRLGTRTLTGWLLELHYAFLSDHAGVFVAGLCGVALCLLGITGLWVHRAFWRSVVTLRWGRGARILCSDLHKAVGVTSTLFHLLLGFTGAYWNLTHVAEEWLHEHPEPPVERRLYGAVSLDALMRDAAGRLPGFRAHYVSLPTEPGAGITLWGAVEPRGALRGPYGSTVTYNELTGAWKTLADLREAGSWRQLVDAFTPLHYGTFGGLPVKLLWCLAGLAPGVLAVSGFAIWRLRRRRSV